ncbi:MAG: MMPL family transporter [Desulfobacterales bacterium]|nr:MMPL family transporter [Desulfobacterales bacterium]
MVEKYIQFIIRRRYFVLGLIFLITAASLASASRGVIATSMIKLFFSQKTEYNLYRERMSEFANDEVFIIAFEDPNPFSTRSIKRLEAVIEKIEEMPDVERVDSILNAQHIFSRGDALHIEKFGEEALARPENAARLLAEFAKDPLYAGLLLSEDGRSQAVIVELAYNEDRPVERGPLLVGEARALFEQGGFEPSGLHSVGLIAIMAEILAQSYTNITRLFPVVCVMLLLVLYLMFQRFWPVFITLVVSLIAVAWTMGFAVLLEREVSIFICLVPAFIFIIATSDVIHLCSAYLLELANGKPKEKAILKSGREVGTACFMTSATTFVGFVSLRFAPTPVIKQFGLVLGFGVGVSLLLAMTLAPILFSITRPPKFRRYADSRLQGLLGGVLRRIEKATIGRPRLIAALFMALLVWACLGVSRLNMETNFTERLHESNHIRVAEKFYNAHFVEANFMDVFIEAPRAEGLLDPGTFLKIAAFQEKLEKTPEVEKVVSLVDLIRKIDGEFNPGRTPLEKERITRGLLAQYLLLFEMSGGEDLGRLVDFDRRTMRLAVRLKGGDLRGAYNTGRKVEHMAADFFQASAAVNATGVMHLMGMFIGDILDGQRRGMIAAFFCILILMIIWLRSIRVGLWSMIPNMLPLLALGGLLGWTWDKVDSDTLHVAIIAIGIGVDDTIHFLMRLRFESGKTGSAITALKRTFHYTGRAIIITTVILAAGFAPFAISDYFSVWMMGVLLPFTLAVALAADLLLVPALVKLGVIQFRKAK